MAGHAHAITNGPVDMKALTDTKAMVTVASNAMAVAASGDTRRIGNWWYAFVHVHGWRYLAFVATAQWAPKGFLMGGGTGGPFNSGLLYFLRSRGVTTVQLSVYMTIVMAPWALKPLLSLIGPRLPVSWKIVPMTLCSIVALIAMTSGFKTISTQTFLGLAFLVSLQVAWVDMLTGGMTAARLRGVPPASKQATSLLSYTWLGNTALTLCGIGLLGPVIDYAGDQWLFALGPPILVPLLLSAALGWWLPPDERRSVDTGATVIDAALFRACIGVGVMALVSAVLMISISADGNGLWLQFIAVIVFSIAALTLTWAALPLTAFLPLAFGFLYNSTWPDINGAVFYFYTDTADVCPVCPHFSATFYQTTLGVIDGIFGMLGVLVFENYFQRWRYRHALRCIMIASTCASLIDVVQFQRWISPNPVPDEWLAAGKGAFQNTMAMLAFMPIWMAMSKNARPGQETQTIALASGMADLGLMVGDVLGGVVLRLSGLQQVDSTGRDDFTNLSAVVVFSLLPSVFLIGTISFFFGDTRMSEDSPPVVMDRLEMTPIHPSIPEYHDEEDDDGDSFSTALMVAHGGPPREEASTNGSSLLPRAHDIAALSDVSSLK